MLIDSSHKKWAAVTFLLSGGAVGAYLGLDANTPGGLSGGSRVGLWYGAIAAALMVFAGSLSFLRKVPTWWWLGPRRVWLKGHLWLGLLSGVFALCHAHFRWGGLLEIVLWLLVLLTLATGVYGLILQQFLPHLITSRVQREAPYEQLPHLCVEMRRKADGLMEKVWSTDVKASQASMMASQTGMGAKMQLQQFYERQVRPFLSPNAGRDSLLASTLQAEVAFARLRALPGLVEAGEQLAEIEDLCEERRQYLEQERLYHWLHVWLLVHIPLSVALLVVGVAHIVTALYY